MDAHSFTARAEGRIYTAAMTRCPDDFYLRVLLGSPTPETETNDEVPPRSATLQRLGSRVIGPATAKPDSFAITVNEGTIGVSGPLIWSVAHR